MERNLREEKAPRDNSVFVVTDTQSSVENKPVRANWGSVV